MGSARCVPGPPGPGFTEVVLVEPLVDLWTKPLASGGPGGPGGPGGVKEFWSFTRN